MTPEPAAVNKMHEELCLAIYKAGKGCHCALIATYAAAQREGTTMTGANPETFGQTDGHDIGALRERITHLEQIATDAMTDANLSHDQIARLEAQLSAAEESEGTMAQGVASMGLELENLKAILAACYTACQVDQPDEGKHELAVRIMRMIRP